MSGYDRQDYDDCADSLKSLGYLVNNPVSLVENLSSDLLLRWSIREVTHVDFIVLLPGWQFGKGANVQLHVARALKIPVVDCGTLEPVWTP